MNESLGGGPRGRRGYAVGDLVIDLGLKRVVQGGAEVELPKLSFDLLVTLVDAAPDVLSNAELMRRVWPGLVVGEKTVNQRVKLLRDALGDDPQTPTYIVGLRGRGYRIAAPVTRLDAAPAVPAPKPETEVAAASVGGPPNEAIEAPTLPSSAPSRWANRARFGGAAAIVALLLGGGVAILLSRSATAPAELPATAPESSVSTVAVLPFRSLGPEENDPLRLGLPEAVVDQLTGVAGLSVIARSSSFRLAGTTSDAREVGERLGARYVVDGSVQRAADRLRVSAQLIDTASGTQVWAERFDRELIDVFSIQDDIARRITDALTQRITEVRPVGERVPPTQNVEAYLAYLRGRDLVARWTIADAAAAEAAFERAIELDSGFAAAYAALYDARMMAAERRTGGGSVGPARPRAWATAGDLAPARERNHILVDKALALDPQSAVAYYARAIWADDRDRSRESDFRRAMTLDPSYGRGITSFAEWLDRQGRGDEAEAMLERAIRIDPLSPRAHFWRVMRTWEARQSAGTLETDMLRVLEVDPDYQPALQRYAKYRWMNHGATAEAIQLIEHAIALDPTNPWSLHTAIAMYLDIGELDTARRLRGRSERPDLSGDVLIKLYEGDVLAAGEAALTDAAFAHGFAEIWRVYDALSDWARATGDYARAIDYIETRVQLTAVTTEFTLANYWAVPALADMLMLTGEDARARALLERCIDWLDRDFLSRLPPVYAVRIKADALLLLGERERALETLRAAFAAADYQQWWYTLERDPNWRALAEDPAFRALAADVHRHVERERSLLAALRAQGLVPAAAPVDTASGH